MARVLSMDLAWCWTVARVLEMVAGTSIYNSFVSCLLSINVGGITYISFANLRTQHHSISPKHRYITVRKRMHAAAPQPRSAITVQHSRSMLATTAVTVIPDVVRVRQMCPITSVMMAITLPLGSLTNAPFHVVKARFASADGLFGLSRIHREVILTMG